MLRAGVTGGSGGSVQIGKRILHGLLHFLAGVKALGLRLLREQGVRLEALERLIAEVIVPGAAIGHGTVLLLERLAGVETVNAQVVGVLGNKAIVDGVVEIAHISGRVGLVADGHGVGVAFDHLGVGDCDDDTDDHEDDGDGDIQGIAAAILRLLVLFALRPGIDITACQILLAALLFSGCTHLFVQSSQLLGFADLQKCY